MGSELFQFIQQTFQMRDSLVNPARVRVRKSEAMYESLRSAVSFLCILDLVFPNSGAA